MSAPPKADFWFAIVLTSVGGAAAFESWRMPRLENLGIDPLSAPGLTPGLLALVLTGLGIALLLRSVRAMPGARETGAPEPGWDRLALTLALCLAYALGLLGRVPFWVATAAFVFAFVMVFGGNRRSWPVRIAVAAVLAGVVAVAVTLLFQRVFLVRLP